MKHQDEASERYQEGVKDARTHVNREKSRNGIEPPRTVAEEVDEMTSASDTDGGHRLRDPLKAVEMQKTERDNGVLGDWIGTTQGANDERDDIEFEKIPNPDNTRERFGSEVKGVPHGD